MALFSFFRKHKQSSPQRQSPQGLDYAGVRSREEAERLVVEGQLARALLFPAEFGGAEIPPNMTWLPVGLMGVRARILETIAGMIESGEVDRMTVTPEYRGDSFVPARLRWHAWSDSKPGVFDTVLEVW